jgi:hypothetical protein
MILLSVYFFLSFCIFMQSTLADSLPNIDERPRIIVTTDGETDDKASFLRFLLYTTDYDIEALIYTNSMWHLKGNGTQWMHDEVPQVNYILNQFQFWRVMAYANDRKNPLKDHEVYSSDWTTANIKNVSDFGSIYDRDKLEEGDSPAFTHTIDTGLLSHFHPSWGGWGGRFEKSGPGNFWIDAEDDGDNTKPLWRFIVPIQEDFAARIQWTKANTYSGANHAPIVKLAHDKILESEAGSKVRLDASPSEDPDGDELIFNWWVYDEVGTYNDSVHINSSNSSKASIDLPKESSGSTIHVICEVKDQNNFPITRYQRVIVNVP